MRLSGRSSEYRGWKVSQKAEVKGMPSNENTKIDLSLHIFSRLPFAGLYRRMLDGI